MKKFKFQTLAMPDFSRKIELFGSEKRAKNRYVSNRLVTVLY
jgi:hypothetical protein